MSIPSVPQPGRLVVSVLTVDPSLARRAAPIAEERFGPVDRVEGPLPFDFTDYYCAEMGHGIQRWLWIFQELVERGRLAEIKLFTNDLEQRFAVDGKRRINLDPGIVTLENFVLASGKNNIHRIYLGDGIFADLTLVYRGGSFQRLEWTYPDYAEPEMISWLNRLREQLKWALRTRRQETVPSKA